MTIQAQRIALILLAAALALAGCGSPAAQPAAPAGFPPPDQPGFAFVISDP